MSFQPFSASTLRRAAIVSPVLAVIVVALAGLVGGAPRPVVGVRLRGGPTEGARTSSWRVELVEILGELRRPAKGRVTVEARFESGETVTAWGTLDHEGATEVALTPRGGHVSRNVAVRIGLDAKWLGVGTVSLTRAEWASHATRRGGWVKSRTTQRIALRAAGERGVFAVPFHDGLWVEATGAATPPRLTLTADGATAEGPFPTERAERSRWLVTPLEHASSVAIVARAEGVPDTRLDVTLAVVPGALHAELRGGDLLVKSPIARERAYVAVVTDSERVAGATVSLAPDGRGGAIGTARLPRLPEAGPLWAVVSSEPDLASGARVGWPIRLPPGADAPTTFDVPDALLLDTSAEAFHREVARARRVRVLAAAFAVLSLALTALLIALGAERARRGLEAHLDHAGADRDTATRVARSGGGSGWLVALAVLCIALAAVGLGIFAAWR